MYVCMCLYYSVVLVPSDVYVLTMDRSVSCVLYVISAVPLDLILCSVVSCHLVAFHLYPFSLVMSSTT